MSERHIQCGHFVGTLGICRRCQPELWAEWHRAEVWWDEQDAAREPMFEEVLR